MQPADLAGFCQRTVAELGRTDLNAKLQEAPAHGG